MIFKTFKKEELRRLFEIMAAANKIVAPVEAGRTRDGKPVYSFKEVEDFEKAALSYTTTKLPAKRYFLPYKEYLATFSIEGDDWQKKVDYNIDRPYVFFGLHACDINALNKLDKVLLGGVYPMPYYAAKRKNVFIVGVDCTPQPFCFRRSMGADTALHGFDMFITDLGESYFAETLEELARQFAGQGIADRAIELLAQMLVRSYDPCISCSVH